MIEEQLSAALRGHEQVRARLPALERDVLDGRVTPTLAARTLLGSFGVQSG
jgi:LAO/AO transport system kinase